MFNIFTTADAFVPKRQLLIKQFSLPFQHSRLQQRVEHRSEQALPFYLPLKSSIHEFLAKFSNSYIHYCRRISHFLEYYVHFCAVFTFESDLAPLYNSLHSILNVWLSVTSPLPLAHIYTSLSNHRHCEYHWFENRHVLPATQTVGPVQS